MNFKFFRYKKGFSLVECTVSLLLFSIITTSVLTVFSVSRNQIKKQNEKYKIDLLADNILSGFQGCNDWDSFRNLLKTDLKINTDGVQTEEETLPIGTDEGIGEYGFDTDNIPVPVPFEKIVVKDGYATFEDKDKNTLVSFAGEYPDNKLTENNDYEWKPDGCYNETKNRVSSRMVLNGKAYPSIDMGGLINYDFTLEIDESNVSLKMGSMENGVTQPACDFDKFLLNNKYYLKCNQKVDTRGLTLYYRFQVFNAEDNKEVKVDGKNLYYCISINSLTAGLLCITDMQRFVAGTNDNDAYYFDLDNCTIKFYIGDKCPSYSKFTEELKNGNQKFKGKWYFLPWFIYKNDGNIEPSCSSYSDGFDYYEYTAQEGVDSEIYYALNSDNTLLLFNCDGQLLFPFSGDTSEALNMLKREEPYCHFTAKTRWVYNDQSYDKWYQQGEMPSKTITKVKFVDNNSQNEKSKIIFYSDDEQPYITFQYSDYEQYKNDRNTIIDFSGSYSDCYKYEKSYSIREQNITNSDIINGWKIGNIANKLNQSLNDIAKTIQYYTKNTVTTYSKLDILHLHPINTDYYKYYTYSATIKAHNEIEQLNYTDKTLTITRDGDVIKYYVNETAEAKLKKVSQVTEVKKTNDCDVIGNKKSLPNANLQIQSDDLSDYKPDNIGNNQKVLNKAKSEWKSSSDNGTATATKTQNEKPDNFDFDNIGGWSLQGEELTEAELYTQGVLSSFKGDGDSFDISIDSKTVFTAHTTDFIITSDGRSVNNTGCTYEIVAEESANVILQTCYIKGEFADMNVIAVVTYSNCTKKIADNDEIKEPKIVIWSVPKSKCPSDIKQITNAEYKNYKYISYRKG